MFFFGKCVVDIFFESIAYILAVLVVSLGVMFIFFSMVFCHSCFYNFFLAWNGIPILRL